MSQHDRQQENFCLTFLLVVTLLFPTAFALHCAAHPTLSTFPLTKRALLVWTLSALSPFVANASRAHVPNMIDFTADSHSCVATVCMVPKAVWYQGCYLGCGTRPSQSF